MGKVSLRPLNISDTDNIVRWRNSDSVKKNLYTQDRLTPEQHIAYFYNVVQAGRCAQFIIVVDEGEKQADVGTAFIKGIDLENRSGEFGIFIGEEGARGKGYAQAATKLILRHAFKALRLHRVYLTVMRDNHAAIRAYEKCGFVTEGIMRDGYLRSDGFVDVVMMSVLEDEWACDQ